MTISTILIGLVTGLALASIYVLIAISVTLVLAASGIFNFAQGTLVMVGTILAFYFGVKLGWGATIAVPLIALLGAIGGLAIYLFAVFPAVGRTKALGQTTVLTTIGLGTAVNAIVAIMFGSDNHRVPSYVSDSPVFLFSLPLRPTYLVIIAAGFGLTLAIDWLVRRTVVGHMFRATLEDPEGAELLGIDTRKIILLAFGVAGALSALAGYLVAPVLGASAFTAQELAFYGFAGMAVGGFGSFAGALVGGAVVGLLGGILPIMSVNPHLTLPLTFAVVVIVLLVKPAGLWGAAGLFGSARSREV